MRKIYLLFFVLFVFCYSSKAQVVINEVYGGGGNASAPYLNDFVELYNKTSSAVTMTNWSIQYTSAGGTTWGNTSTTKATFSGTIPANSYFLVQLASGGAIGVTLPTADATGTINMSATAGKLVLCNNATTVSQIANPTDANIIDKVGYGSTATGFETAPASGITNTTSIQRTPIGTDNNNNSADFTVGPPSPTNAGSGVDITPPTISSLLPADNATGVNTTFTAIITFSEAIQKGTGIITLKKVSDNSVVQSFDVTMATVTVSGSAAYFDVSGLAYNTDYYFEIPSGSFNDLSNNAFGGTSGATAWNFTTSASVPTAALSTTYNFNNCLSTAGIFSDGFTQFSQAGEILWACTTFGRDPANPAATTPTPNGVQINGFANNTNVPNIDWFISPKFDLSGTTYPLLSFWSRTRFNGLPLQLKVSTNYTGTGDPNLATWTDLNGRFPQQASDVWTQSSNINLTAFKTANVYIAFVYTSTDEEGARWTMDDIRIDNSATPPPPSLTVSTNDIQYTFVASGSTSNKTVAFTANDITGNVTIASSSPNFLLSKDGTAFSNSITYTVAEANNASKTVYVQFAPDQVNKTFSDAVTITTSSLTGTVNVKGTSIDPAVTLEVVNWNMEWFGSTDPSLGPTNDALQQSNAQTILQNIGADVYGLVEVVDEARLATIVSNMPGYSYVICNYGSHVNPPDPFGGPLSAAQKEAFVYKTSVFSNISTRPLINNQDISSTSYNSWSSGRYPFLMKADVTLNGQTKTINFVLIHAKANTSPTTTSYARRQAAATELHDTLNTYFPNDNIIVLGDFNDDLDQSITAGFTTTSYSAFTTDNTNFYSPTLALSLAGKKSTVSFNDVIDHVVLSNEMKAYYMGATASVLTDVATLVSNYGSTTTDHYPVFTRYAFDPAILLPVKLVSFTAVKEDASVKLNWQTSQELNTKEFSVEHSTNGIHFTSIASVNATGTVSAGASYQALDAHPNTGTNYYRLKTIDFDGKYEYSKIVKLNFDKAFTVGLSPNPASNKVTITLTNSLTPLTMQLVDMSGQVVKSFILTNSANSFSIAGISKGLYLVKVQSSNATYTEKLIIE